MKTLLAGVLALITLFTVTIRITVSIEPAEQAFTDAVTDFALSSFCEYSGLNAEDFRERTRAEIKLIPPTALALARLTGMEENAERIAQDFEERLHRIALYEGMLFEDWETDWVDEVFRFHEENKSLLETAE